MSKEMSGVPEKNDGGIQWIKQWDTNSGDEIFGKMGNGESGEGGWQNETKMKTY